MKKLICILISAFLLGISLGNAQLINEKMFKKMEKEAKGSYFSCEEGLPENTLKYFDKKGETELGYITLDSLKNKRLSYRINEKDSLIVWFDSIGVSFGADYKMKEYTIPLDSKEWKRLDSLFTPVINQ